MEERAALAESRGFWHWMTRPAFVLAGGFAVVVMVALAVTAVRRTAGSRSLDIVASVNSRGVDGADGVPQRLKPLPGHEGYGPAEAAPLSRAGFPGRTGESGGARESLGGEGRAAVADFDETLPTDQEALAVREMLAPSKPAPPLPLTHQERMLAQVVHKGEPEELATLRPDVREKQMEISKAEYQAFFEPLTVKDNE
jgi:hypothetical protein